MVFVGAWKHKSDAFQRISNETQKGKRAARNETSLNGVYRENSKENAETLKKRVVVVSESCERTKGKREEREFEIEREGRRSKDENFHSNGEKA